MNNDKKFEKMYFLNRVANEILLEIRKRGNVSQMLDENTRHDFRNGFERVDFHISFLEKHRDNPYFKIEEMAVELLMLEAELSSHNHYHNDSYASVVILGQNEGLPEPKDCFYFLDSAQEKIPARSGIFLEFFPKRVHGFTSPNGNKFYFISIQSKRIDEDFHVVS